MLVLSDITLTYSKDYTNVMLYGTDQPNNNFDYLFLDFLRVNTSSTGMFCVEHPLVCGCRKSVIFSISMH